MSHETSKLSKMQIQDLFELIWTLEYNSAKEVLPSIGLGLLGFMYYAT